MAFWAFSRVFLGSAKTEIVSAAEITSRIPARHARREGTSWRRLTFLLIAVFMILTTTDGKGPHLLFQHLAGFHRPKCQVEFVEINPDDSGKMSHASFGF